MTGDCPLHRHPKDPLGDVLKLGLDEIIGAIMSTSVC
jgi:hypothetical protein